MSNCQRPICELGHKHCSVSYTALSASPPWICIASRVVRHFNNLSTLYAPSRRRVSMHNLLRRILAQQQKKLLTAATWRPQQFFLFLGYCLGWFLRWQKNKGVQNIHNSHLLDHHRRTNFFSQRCTTYYSLVVSKNRIL